MSLQAMCVSAAQLPAVDTRINIIKYVECHGYSNSKRGRGGKPNLGRISFLCIYFTSVLLTRERALAASEDPEYEVGHPECEDDDGVAEHQGEDQDQDHGP